jgi:copper transport protein
VLLVKVGLVALVGVLAVVNNRWLVPAVREGDTRARRTLFDTVRIEALGLLAAVVVTAALVNIEPARLAAEGGLYEATVPFGEGNAVVQVDPARAGENAVHVYLLDDVGRQFDLPSAPTFGFSLPEQDVGPITRTPWRVGRGHYTLDGSEMSIPGTWTLEIRARVSEFDEYVATVEVPVS